VKHCSHSPGLAASLYWQCLQQQQLLPWQAAAALVTTFVDPLGWLGSALSALLHHMVTSAPRSMSPCYFHSSQDTAMTLQCVHRHSCSLCMYSGCLPRVQVMLSSTHHVVSTTCLHECTGGHCSTSRTPAQHSCTCSCADVCTLISCTGHTPQFRFIVLSERILSGWLRARVTPVLSTLSISTPVSRETYHPPSRPL